jgi:hypothetical protein
MIETANWRFYCEKFAKSEKHLIITTWHVQIFSFTFGLFPIAKDNLCYLLHFFNPSLSGGFLFLIFYMNEVIHDLEQLKAMIQPGNISYISWGGALPSRALEVWKIIWEIDNPGLLEKLLIHANTLAREPNLDEDKTYPISTVREAIQKRLNAVKI